MVKEIKDKDESLAKVIIDGWHAWLKDLSRTIHLEDSLRFVTQHYPSIDLATREGTRLEHHT